MTLDQLCQLSLDVLCDGQPPVGKTRRAADRGAAMPTDAERIAAIRRQTLDLIAEITAQPKPTYDIDGQKISWGEYLGQLQKTVQWCNQQAAASAPTEMRSQGYT